MASTSDSCSPCGLAVEATDHRADFLALLGHEDEPLVLLTHLLRWCRDEHRLLWEQAQHHPAADRGALQSGAGPWPEVGAEAVVSRHLRKAMACSLQEASDLIPVATARAIARRLDDCFWPSFRGSFERRSPYQPGVGDPIPLDSPDIRDLTHMTPTAPPWRLANRLDETRHVRLAGEWAVQFRVVFDYTASSALAGLVSPSTVVATCHPNRSLSELTLGDGTAPWLFPVAPAEHERQADLIDELIATACRAGASIVVLPELSATERIAADLESWVRRDDGPLLLVAGSYHHLANPEAGAGPGRHVNTAVTWLRGHPAPLTHEKHSPGDRPRPEGIQPEGWPELRVYVGADGFHLVVAICRDLLNPSAVHALTEAGANLVLVPAMSETLTPFVGAAANLVTSSQALVAVANNPAVWSVVSGGPASRPPRALLGHPGLGSLTRLVQTTDSAPGVALMRMSSGQLTWVPVQQDAARGRRDHGRPARPAPPLPNWVEPLAEAVCVSERYLEDRSTTAPARAAVLVLLSGQGDDVSILLTARAPDLSRHPGTITFPGGLVEPTDRGVVETALREAAEETGIDPDAVEVLGVMAPIALPADDLIVFPVLAYRREDQIGWSLNYAEVDALAEIPLGVLARAAATSSNEPRIVGTTLDLRAHIGEATRAIVDRLVGGTLRTSLLAALDRTASRPLDRSFDQSALSSTRRILSNPADATLAAAAQMPVAPVGLMGGMPVTVRIPDEGAVTGLAADVGRPAVVRFGGHGVLGPDLPYRTQDQTRCQPSSGRRSRGRDDVPPRPA